MLVLSRRKDESIVIGENIEITVIGFSGNQVRLGIKAPRAIPVNRKEIFEAIRSDRVGQSDEYFSYQLQLI